MKRIFNYYFYLSFVSVLLTIFTFESIAANCDYAYSIIVGLATLVLYNFHPYIFNADKISDHKFKYWSILCLIVLLAIFLEFQLNLTFVSCILLLVAFALCAAYFIKSNGNGLRSHYLLKPLVIGIVFGICTATVPYLQSGYLIMESLILSLGRVFFIATLALIFDIGDINQDKLERTETLPSKWGIKKAKLFSVSIIIIAGLIELWGAWIFLIDIKGIVAIGFTYSIVLLAIYFSNPDRKWWFYEVFVDGIIGLPLIFLLLL